MGLLEKARNFVGWPDYYKEVRDHQFEVLMEQGLRPEHVLLEVGAGCLDLGRKLIEYLDPLNYSALEPNEWLVIASRVSRKDFHFYGFDDFVLTRARAIQDFIFAHSILTHADRAQIRTLLSEAVKVLVPNGVLIASFYDQGCGDSDHVGWMYPNGCVYTAEFIEKLAKEAGFHLAQTESDPRHPFKHSWLFARKT